jgi:hypothetical protein
MGVTMLEGDWRDYGRNMVAGYDKWFWDQVDILEKKYLWCFWAGLVLSILATITAAFPNKFALDLVAGGDDILKWLVVVFSTLATFFNVTLVTRYKKLLDDRDKGRIRLDMIKQRFEISTFPEEGRTELEKVIAEIASIESDLGGLTKSENAPTRN